MRVFQHHLYTCGCRSVVLLCREFLIYFLVLSFLLFFATRTKSIDGSSRGACRRLNWHTRNTTKYIESLQHEFASQSILKGLAEDIFLLRLSLSLSGNPLENSRDVFFFSSFPCFLLSCSLIVFAGLTPRYKTPKKLEENVSESFNVEKERKKFLTSRCEEWSYKITIKI